MYGTSIPREPQKSPATVLASVLGAVCGASLVLAVALGARQTPRLAQLSLSAMATASRVQNGVPMTPRRPPRPVDARPPMMGPLRSLPSRDDGGAVNNGAGHTTAASPALLMASVAAAAGALAWALRPKSRTGPFHAAAALSGERLDRPPLRRGPAHGAARHLFSTAVAETSENALLQQEGLPKFKSITPSDVEPAIRQILATLSDEFKQLEGRVENCAPAEAYAVAIEGLERLSAPLSYAWGVVGHLTSVKSSDTLRAVQQAMQPEVVKATQVLGQSRPLFRALEAIRGDAAVWAGLEKAQQRIVESALRQMRHSGVGLEGEALARFNAIALELAELSTKFSNNLLDSTKAFALLLTTPEEVQGLPASAKALAAQTAVMKGHTGATPDAGPWVLTLDMPSYLPAMQNLENRDLREQLLRASATRASTEPFDNAALIPRILALRQEKARLLGYQTHAELSLASKMAGAVEDVDRLSEMVRTAAFAPAQAELAAVRAFAAERGFEGELALWDVPYWSERRKEALYDFKQEELRPYLALPKVLSGLFALCERLFDITITPADGEAEIWHPDVRFFKVFDKGDHVASFYLDPYSRPEDKQGGAWMGFCLGASRVLQHKPVAYLVCNGSPPNGDVPSLMRFQEVNTLFHEMGHGLQHMLTRVSHGDAAGISNIEWDAVELPSQFMENWCYDRQTLNGFAVHYATGEPLPEELYQKVVAQKNYQAAMMTLRQLLFGRVDMELHHRYDPTDPAAPTPFELMASLAPQYSVLAPLPEDRFLCSFQHIFAGGYSAGYYSYLWAEVMSADAFAAFEEAGLDDEAAVRAVGRKFRETVLALGGGQHPGEVYEAFRGRGPTPDALLRHRGLAQ